MYENHTGDTAYLQDLLRAGGEVVIPKTNPLTGDEIWIISSPLFLTSHTTVILDGAHLRLADGVYANIFATEVPIGAPMTAADCLHDIHILGKNGALLDGGIHNGLTEKTANKDGRPSVLNNTFVYLRGVIRFSVSHLRIINPRYWGLTFAFCSEGEITDIDFTAANDAPNQDGIDLRVGCHDIVIRNITGSTGDDTVALTGLLGVSGQKQQIEGLSPDIHDVVIENISAYVTGGHGIIRLLCHDGVKLYNVRIAHIHDGSIDCDGVRCQAAIRIGDCNYSTIRRALPEEMHDITVEDVYTNAKYAVKLFGGPQNFILSDIRTTDPEGYQLITC
ncbi:MAG: hypothetical protein IKZ09_05630 [Clostridia bacterium]|nr:hypothetical protein [Clostridia bacterium]